MIEKRQEMQENARVFYSVFNMLHCENKKLTLNFIRSMFRSMFLYPISFAMYYLTNMKNKLISSIDCSKEI